MNYSSGNADKDLARNYKSQTHNSDDSIISKLNELKYALQKKGKISEEEYPFINCISYEERKKDELIISKDDEIVDMYIVLKGRIKVSAFPPAEVHKELNERDQFDIISQINIFKTVKPCQTFGNFSCFSPDKGWKSIYAYPEGEDAELLKIDFQSLKILFEEQNEEQKKFEMLAFLSDSIPGFKYRAKKEKFIKYFEKKVCSFMLKQLQTFKPGHVLIREGERSEFAYIVNICSVIGYFSQIHKAKKPNQRTVVNTNGYFSHTLNSFQIGIIEEKQWAGDEILARKDEPFLYSVVCQTCVELLCISKADLTNSSKINKDIQEQLRDKAQKKLEWVTKRFIDICLGVENISRWDNIYEEFKEKVNEAARRFPKANHQALMSFINNLPETKKSLDEVVNQFQNPPENIKAVLDKTSIKQNSNQSMILPNHTLGTINQSNMQSPLINKRMSFAHKTITLSPKDYGGRPKTAVHSSIDQTNTSYYGGFFNTQANFQKQIIDQQMRTSQVVSPKDIVRDSQQSMDMGFVNHILTNDNLRPQSQGNISQYEHLYQPSFVIRPNTSGLMLGGLHTNNMSQSALNITSQRYSQINSQIKPSKSSFTLHNQKNQSILLNTMQPGGFSQTKMSLTPNNLAQIPTLKNLAQTPMQQKNPQKIAMESASTFVISHDQKYTVPTFSKLQLAKRQNYEKIIKFRQDSKYNKKQNSSEILEKLKQGMVEKHQTFILSDHTVQVKTRLKRQITPNFVNQWAEQNNLDLLEISNPELAKKKQKYIEKQQSLQRAIQNQNGGININHNHLSQQQKFQSRELNRKLTVSQNKIVQQQASSKLR
ncbi:UNKNOWN [Stylonychia lemnae]|uniref:Cyclic nucleotide-binding domain-containing protein n=1 Tax=Stylonychia lemnae TaxID=5949 RepID=A0A078AC91_STYLE|nr:UNKNOWN [Stylonychia lemnae]|eukprot:CDW79456.1 UNKNOWN [Stylonychia lemnae]